jgi:hypothetical protein
MNGKKALFAVVLCLIMVLGLLLYSHSSLPSLMEGKLHGEWTTTVSAARYVEDVLRSNMGAEISLTDDVEMTYVFQFKADGTLILYLDEASGKAMVKLLKDAMKQVLPELLYSQFLELQGMDKAAADAMLAEEGSNMEELVELTLADTDFDYILQRETSQTLMYYELRDGKLYYAASPDTLNEGLYDLCVEPVFRGKTLTLQNAVDAQGEAFEGSSMVKYPLTLQKK